MTSEVHMSAEGTPGPSTEEVAAALAGLTPEKFATCAMSYRLLMTSYAENLLLAYKMEPR